MGATGQDISVFSCRVGQGFDVHAFAPERSLILGGVRIPDAPGLAGHSDADVLVHAVIDAVLGALALGDIGAWFPDDDAAWEGADSLDMLRCVLAAPQCRKWRLNNLDATIVAQKPRLRRFVPAMRKTLAETCNLPLDAVSVKATTTERLGFVGREEGIAALAVVLLVQKRV